MRLGTCPKKGGLRVELGDCKNQAQWQESRGAWRLGRFQNHSFLVHSHGRKESIHRQKSREDPVT